MTWSLLKSCKKILHFHYAFEFYFSITRVHVRLLGPCFKTGQADHTWFRLQWLEQSQILPDRQLIHKSHYGYPSIQNIYTTRPKVWPRFNACSLRTTTAKVFGNQKLKPQRIYSNLAPKIPFQLHATRMIRRNAAHYQQNRKYKIVKPRMANLH